MHSKCSKNVTLFIFSYEQSQINNAWVELYFQGSLNDRLNKVLVMLNFTLSFMNRLNQTDVSNFKRGSCMVWEIYNMGVCPRLDFENITLFNCLGYNFNIYGAFEFLCNSIANL